MHYTDTGSGTPLVLFHGFCLDSRMWDPVRDGLSAHVRLITPDQRGFGRSPLGDDPPSLETVAADMVGLLDDLGLERAVIGGCSMGGYVAMAVLRAAPERVSGVLLVDTKAREDVPEAKANRLAVAARAEREGTAPWLADQMLPTILVNRSCDGIVREWMEAQPRESVAWAQRAMADRVDSRETLRGLDIDALVVHGEADGLMPVELAEELAELTAGKLAVLPGAGHLPPVERPEEFVAAVTPWLTAR
ncbi:alpha/beta fold hydrolase [Actinokineospora iranica]|uniref:alpha/beta fold hydrolase n=1 Tax=Actinokineospora iranica TaxID=1271860 RepID=UPI000B85C540|nr:alpha/beta hydrolase [Actinokineospora iranica]